MSLDTSSEEGLTPQNPSSKDFLRCLDPQGCECTELEVGREVEEILEMIKEGGGVGKNDKVEQ